jgi:Flp pilus assembly protein TadG
MISRLALVTRFSRDGRGVSAVEFALVAPVMITLYFGCVDISDGVAADRKVTLVAATVANLAAQVSTISTADMDDLLKASTSIMSPYSAGPLKITVSCLSIDANKNVTVKWTRDADSGGVSGTITVPEALKESKTYPVQFIFSRVAYTYTPIVGEVITGSLTLSDQMYMAPRQRAPTYKGISCT